MIASGKYAEAIDLLSKALKLDPTMTLAFNARGYAHLLLRQVPEALADFNEAIRINPGYVNAYQNRATARRLSGDKAGADADDARFAELSKPK